ncbi:MAG: hypothetical protein ACE5EY_17475, partial [Anaerolineae bacterium]
MAPNAISNITVVYVEDEPNIAQLLVSGLGLFGITVYPVYMSAEALLDSAAMRRSRPLTRTPSCTLDPVPWPKRALPRL